MTVRRYDVIVTGAGPAGVCAAVGLQRQGYAVALLEGQPALLPRMGETLTPGVVSILEFLGLDSVLPLVPKVEPSGTLSVWDSRTEAKQLRSDGAVITDRALFASRMLRAARRRGIDCLAPANGVPQRDGEQWHAAVAGNDGTETVAARLWIDTCMTHPPHSGHRVPLAPAAIALWAEFECDPEGDPLLSRVEALHDAWLHGSATAGGTYRVLAVCDPRVPRSLEPGAPSLWLREALARSTLLRGYAAEPMLARMGHAAVGPYLHADPCRPGFMKAGDAALALDPLLSCGIENAMRHALECVVPAHMQLDHPDAEESARGFFLDRLVESAADHACRTACHYANAWAANEESFWRKRSCAQITQGAAATELGARLSAKIAMVRASATTQEVALPLMPNEASAPQTLFTAGSIARAPAGRGMESSMRGG